MMVEERLHAVHAQQKSLLLATAQEQDTAHSSRHAGAHTHFHPSQPHTLNQDRAPQEGTIRCPWFLAAAPWAWRACAM